MISGLDSILAYLKSLGEAPPTDDRAYEHWIHGTDVLDFLSTHVHEVCPVLIAGPDLFVDSAFVPKRRITGEYWEDLLEWHSIPSLGWSSGLCSRGSGRGMVPAVFGPLDHTGSEILAHGEPVFFWRHFQAQQPPNYLELNQRVAQLTWLHPDQQRSVYVRLNDCGDLLDLAKMVERDGYTVGTVDRDVLDYYMLLTDQVLVRCFETLRIQDLRRSHDGERFEKSYIDQDAGLFGSLILGQEGNGRPHLGRLKGVQIVRPSRPRTWLLRQLHGDAAEPKRYATFTIHDWKTGGEKEWSCDPARLGNYFVESDLPFETSPAFFRPDVLTRYKQNPEKYRLTDTRISCRGGWTLRYNVNSEHQVTALVCDLGDLPYSEQLHWKASNEPPKAGLSDRAMAALRGDPWTDTDPLAELGRLLRDLPSAQHDGKPAPIWAPKASGLEATLKSLHYVYDNSPREWEDEIIRLSAVVVDRLQVKTLRRVAEAAGYPGSQSLGSLAALKVCLEARGIEPDRVRRVHGCIAELRDLRSTQTAAHGGSAKPVPDWRVHYRATLTAVVDAIRELATLVNEGVFDLP